MGLRQETSCLSKILNSQPLKKMIAQLLLSVSIFSFVFSYYSLRSSSLFHHLPLQHYLSANPFGLHAHAMNKNYIFLICNGLLVLLSKTSDLVRSSSGFDLNDMLQKRVGDGLMICDNFEKREPFSERPTDDERILNEVTINETLESNGELCGVSDENIHEEDEFADQEEVVDEEWLSNEELNKKFEEFIRKTKEEIMFNDARQRVTVK